MLRLITILSLLIATAFAGHLSRWEGRIVGGRNASIGQIPYQASIRTPLNFHVCGASVISVDWVVSAAHCTVFPRTIANTRIVAGTVDYEGGTLLRVSRILNHPRYNSAVLDFDISLIKTLLPMVFTDALKSIRIARSSIGGGLPAIASGWGQTSSENLIHPRNLQYIEYETITNAECQSMMIDTHPIHIHNSTICAFGGVGRGTCFRDSGGPLAVNNELVGVVSWGIPCGVGKPDMYSRVDYSSGWIIGVTGITN